MNAPRTARERARVELTAAIKEVAGRHLAEQGAAGLSLRAVARELGMASSAVYRYFASRDELLTALIIDAYDSLANAVEAADGSVARPDHHGRWVAAAGGIRSWALAHPQQYGLLYGAPVPGYQAPQDTIGPATRATFVFVDILRAAADAGRLAPPRIDPVPLPAGVHADLEPLSHTLFSGIPLTTVALGILGWTSVFGLVSFELNGQFQNVLDHRDEFFSHSLANLGALIGLVPEGSGGPAESA